MAARTPLEHSKVIFAAIIPDRPDLLDSAVIHLNDTHFPDGQYKSLFLLLQRFLEVAGNVMTRVQLSDMLAAKNVDAGKTAMYLEMYDAAAATTATDSDFRWSQEQLKQLSAERNTAEALTEGMEILNKGIEKGKDTFTGHQDARAYVLEKFADVDRELAKQAAPEGDAREEAEDIWREINNPENAVGTKFGIASLDNVVGGNHNGELNLIMGYTNSGKSMLASGQLPWSAAIEQGKNVVVLTTETLRQQLRRRLLCRHSRLPMFDLPKGINSRDLKKGKEFLSPAQLKVLPDIIEDFTKNTSYGKLVLVQVPRNATITSCENRVLKYQREFSVDLVVIDSINLLRADRRYPSKREELASMLIEAKQFATTFDDGRGVPVISPWQASRDAWKTAQEKGFYDTSGLSETHESSASADVIISILEPQGQAQREVPMKVQVLKHRDGEKSSGLDINVDYATAYWYENGSGNASGSLDSLLTVDSGFGSAYS